MAGFVVSNDRIHDDQQLTHARCQSDLSTRFVVVGADTRACPGHPPSSPLQINSSSPFSRG